VRHQASNPPNSLRTCGAHRMETFNLDCHRRICRRLHALPVGNGKPAARSISRRTSARRKSGQISRNRGTAAGARRCCHPAIANPSGKRRTANPKPGSR
jgi:hypothetical protein